MIDPEKIACLGLPTQTMEAVWCACHVADGIFKESLDFAQNLPGGERTYRDEMAITLAHMRASATIYAAHELTSAIREAYPEIAGAISEAGTDVGAGIAEGLSVASQPAIPKKARCRDSKQTDDEPNDAKPGPPGAAGAIDPALQKIIDDDKLAVPVPPQVREQLKTLRASFASSGAIAPQSKT